MVQEAVGDVPPRGTLLRRAHELLESMGRPTTEDSLFSIFWRRGCDWQERHVDNAVAPDPARSKQIVLGPRVAVLSMFTVFLHKIFSLRCCTVSH